jgi:uncharacterized membrane protein YgcG
MEAKQNTDGEASERIFQEPAQQSSKVEKASGKASKASSKEKAKEEKDAEKEGSTESPSSYWWAYLIGAIVILIIILVMLYFLGNTCQEEEKDSVLCMIAESVKTLVDAVGAGVAAIAENIGLFFAAFFAWIGTSIVTLFTGGKKDGKPGDPGRPGGPGGPGGDGPPPGDGNRPPGGGPGGNGDSPSKPPRKGR